MPQQPVSVSGEALIRKYCPYIAMGAGITVEGTTVVFPEEIKNLYGTPEAFMDLAGAACQNCVLKQFHNPVWDENLNISMGK